MKDSNNKPATLKAKTLGLALAALIPAAAQANDNWHRYDAAPRANVSGTVEVTHQIPGGTITVGAEWGQRPAPQPQVVVVQDHRRPEVVVIEKEHGRGHGYGRAHKHEREVTIIREEPRKVVIIKEVPARRVVVVEQKPACGAQVAVVDHRGYTESREYRDGNQVSVQKSGPNGSYQYYKDANQVSEQRTDASGSYHYYEDRNQVSIQDNREGRERNVYVRK